MARTIFFFFFVWLTLFLSIILFIPYPLFSLAGYRKKYVWFWAHHWSRFAIKLSGSKLELSGVENIPAYRNFVILSNHQGFMDIPVLLAVFPYTLSFVAKKELLWIPLINLWLLAQDCILIDRSRPHQAHHTLIRKLRSKSKNPLVLFPEGTRSKSKVEGRRKQGGIKLVEEAGIPVIYTQINGTYKIWEEKKQIRPAKISVRISVNYEKLPG